MKDTPSSAPIDTPNTKENSITTTMTTTTTTTPPQQQNDENKNIIFADDDENNRNILRTTVPTNSPNDSKCPTIDGIKKYNDDDMISSKGSDIDMHTETPLPEWVTLNESVLIRPYNTSGVISFIGPTHFSVSLHYCHFHLSISCYFLNCRAVHGLVLN